MSRPFVFALVLVLVPVIAPAQTSRATLPLLTVDGQLGDARHPERSGATYYRSNNIGLARVAVGVRLGPAAGFRPVAVLDYFSHFGMGDHVSDCRYAPNGTCKQYFPDVSGFTVGIGVRNTLGKVITVGLIGGIGRYHMGGHHLPNESLTGFHADAELALRFMKHAGMVLNVRHVETGKFKDARMWYRPILIGLRLQ